MPESHETRKLHGIVRNGGALAVLVLAYSMNWMNLVDTGADLGAVRSGGVSVSPSVGARETLVVDPGEMEFLGVPLTMAAVGLFFAAVLRIVWPAARRLHPLIPASLAATGTVMLGTVFGYAIHDETARFFTSGFYIALAAFALNTVFDGFEWLDWRARASKVPETAETAADAT
ncbi:MAG: hypothetical protein AAGG01_07335 [Planctomycetota bacterium]